MRRINNLKRLLLALLSLFLMAQAHAASVGPKFTTTIFNDVSGWVNTANAAASDSVYSTYAMASSIGNTNDIAFNTFDFSAIPGGSTVNGIVFTAIAKTTTASDTKDGVATFCNNGGGLCTDKTAGTFIATTNTTFTYGSSADTWGGMTLADVQNSGSTFYWACNHTTTAASKTCSLDSVSETVTYTTPSGAHLLMMMGVGSMAPPPDSPVRQFIRQEEALERPALTVQLFKLAA